MTELQARYITAEKENGISIESVMDPALWPTNRGTDRDWGFQAAPNPHLDGRALSMSVGKGLGGGSSVNVMVWAWGHRSDWDHFAAETDPGWNFASVLDIYRRIENWQGQPDPKYRGTTGPVWVQPAKDPSPIAFGCWMQPKASAFHASIPPMVR